MKNPRIQILFVLAFISFSACQEKNDFPKTCLGECSYHPGFLWSKADTCGVTKQLILDFNADAKGDSGTFVEFAFVDKNGDVLPDDVLEISVDSIIIKGNTFKVKASDKKDERCIRFRLLPKAKRGNHQGYIKLTSYKLDRFEDQELDGMPTEVMQWDLMFNKKINPLAKVLMWIGICLLAHLTVWFTVLKSFFYPRIRLLRLELSTKKGYYVNKKINGSRMVVVTNSYKPQSLLSKVFTGKIIYIKDELWTSPWELSPKGRRKIAKINLHGKYMISPVTSEIDNYGTYQLDNLTTKETVTIKIL